MPTDPRPYRKPLRRRIRQAICAVRGHRPAKRVSGLVDGRQIRAMICPRCELIFGSEVGSRQERRARRRAGIRA